MNVQRIRLLAEAVRDLETGQAFYEGQQQGIGDYFWDSLLADIESLLIHGGVHARAYGSYRMLAKRFPYAVYYQITGQQADILAVLPLRRNPAWLKRQLNSRG